MTNVLIVEDSKIEKDFLEMKLNESEEFNVVASIENAANAEIACLKGDIDLVLMDVCTADDHSGLEAAARIKKNYPKIKVIIMTSMPECSFIGKAKDIGCDGFWYKEYGNVEFIDVCEKVMNGEIIFPSDSPNLQIGEVSSKELTKKELDIIRRLAAGMKYSDIAEQLGITENTVKFHIKNILSKTGYSSALQLVSNVVEKRLIMPNY